METEKAVDGKSGSLWFVTPAWGRYEIVALCLEQRRRVIEELGRRGIEAYQVVIADDDNLEIAEHLGAHIIEQDNRMVGRKFNDGMAYAGKQGAEWIVPIGSDSWIATDYFLGEPLDPATTRTSPAYCSVTRRQLAELWVAPNRLDHAAGPYVFHRSLLEPCNFRPSEESSTQVDTSTIEGIRKHSEINWEVKMVHPYQYVGFRVFPMMTSHRSLVRRWLVANRSPWDTLRRHYPADLVVQARKVMSRER